MGPATAAIDLGTNTARLLIGFAGPDGCISPVLVKRRITRLGGGFSREEGLSREARDRSIEALTDFADEMKHHGVGNYRAVATSAVRDAANGRQFCDEVLRVAGVGLEIIDGREEGILTLNGVLAGLDDCRGNFLIFDIGGGSTEYSLATDRQLLFTESMHLGVVRLTEGKGAPDRMTEKIDRELSLLESALAEAGLATLLPDTRLVGTAGTATTLAAISMKMTEYDYRKVNNYRMSLHDIREIYATLLPLSPADRLTIPGMEKGREDLIIAGMLVTLRTMERFGFSNLTVSDFGLLEGLFLSICR
jgi:exopolyphosphatase/guanosine-5'-triphosphate,3'-diphosphate pyrophosphatase